MILRQQQIHFKWFTSKVESIHSWVVKTITSEEFWIKCSLANANTKYTLILPSCHRRLLYMEFGKMLYEKVYCNKIDEPCF